MQQEIVIIANNRGTFLEVCEALQHNKMNVIQYNDIIDAKAGLAKHSPAFLLLDYGTKGTNFLLNELMSSSLCPHPYIIVTAPFLDSATRAAMLQKGADICVEQPVFAEEILAIIEAVQRRTEQNKRPFLDNHRFQIKYKELVIDTLHRSVTMRGTIVALTRKEYNVLCALANRAGTVMTKEEIYTAVWKSEYNSKTTNVSDQISSLRQKLGLTSKDTTYIQTVIGVGYRFGGLT